MSGCLPFRKKSVVKLRLNFKLKSVVPGISIVWSDYLKRYYTSLGRGLSGSINLIALAVSTRRFC